MRSRPSHTARPDKVSDLPSSAPRPRALGLERLPVAAMHRIDSSIAAIIDRARAVLGYAPRFSTLKTLRESVQWLTDNRAVEL
jgi:nucleoside-diphosphate-sugar epimerase